MKILYVIHRCWPYKGGAESLFWEWAKGSRDNGFDVTVFTTDAWDIEYFHNKNKIRIPITEEIVDDIKIKRFKVVSFPRPIHSIVAKLLSSIPFLFFQYSFGYPNVFLPGYLLKMVITREKYDLINTGVFPHLFLTYSAIRFSERTNTSIFCTPLVHLGEPNSNDIKKHFLVNKNLYLLNKSNRIITMSHIEKQALIQKGIEEEKINVVGAAVHPEKVIGGSKERFCDTYGIQGKTILQISTQTHDKGSHHILEAMKLIWMAKINAKLVLIGQIMEDFESFFMKQPPSVYQNTLLLDYTDEQTKKDALAACDIFVMPSRVESFGIVYLEAWLYKKPVIGAFAGAIPEIIDNGKDGLLVPFGDIHMMSEYIMLLLKYPELSYALGENGYSKVINKFTWAKNLKKLHTAYNEILTGHKN